MRRSAAGPAAGQVGVEARTGGDPVQQGAQRPDVVVRAGRLAAQPAGVGVRDRGRTAAGRQHPARREDVGLVRVGQLRAVRGDEHVARRDPAVHQPGRVQVGRPRAASATSRNARAGSAGAASVPPGRCSIAT